MELFTQNRHNPSLKNHKLTGAKKERRAFSITGDVPVVYVEISIGEVILLNIGSHNQVY